MGNIDWERERELNEKHENSIIYMIINFNNHKFKYNKSKLINCTIYYKQHKCNIKNKLKHKKMVTTKKSPINLFMLQ